MSHWKITLTPYPINTIILYTQRGETPVSGDGKVTSTQSEESVLI